MGGRGGGRRRKGEEGDETPTLHAPQSIFLDMPLRKADFNSALVTAITVNYL